MRAWTTLVLLLFAILVSGTVHGQDQRDAARALALEGIALLKEGKHAEAIAKLEEAEQKFHAPTHHLYIARAQRGLGKLIEAHATYVGILIEEVPNYAPAAFHDAQQSAGLEIEELRSQVATLSVSVSGVPLQDVTVTLDGTQLERGRLAHPIAVTPGSHTVEASAVGAAAASQTAEATVGQSQKVELKLTASAAPSGGDESPDQPSAEPGGFPVAAVIALGVGAAALGAGAITGAMTLSKASDIKSNCNGDVCPPEQESDADDAKTLGNVSTAMFVIGGVAASLGVVLLVMSMGDDSEEAAAATPPVRLTLEATPGGAIIRGTF